MFEINQHWDRLNSCAVGSCYPPEFYSFVQNSNVRSIMEKISIETEEDYLNLIKLLSSFNVNIVRCEIKGDALLHNKLLPPPLSPRDHLAIVGNTFYCPDPTRSRKWDIVKNHNYPSTPPSKQQEFDALPIDIKIDLANKHNINNLFDCYGFDYSALSPIVEYVKNQGNKIVYNKNIDSAMTCRVGKDLFFGTWPGQNKDDLRKRMQNEFPEYRCHVIESSGHLDGVMTPIKEGLILCRKDYMDTIPFDTLFPDWEIVPIYRQVKHKEYLYEELKQKNAGRWWLPGEEYNDDFTEFVNSYMDFCVGNIEETTIGVNVLMIDENNLVCSEEDSRVFKVLESHGVTPHVVPIRHHYFWDNGIHCLTCDLDRSGPRKDFFPNRAQNL